MVMNPCCCGCSLQTGSEIIAVLQIIGSVIILITSILGLLAVTKYYDEVEKEVKKDHEDISKTVLIVVMSLLLGASCVNLILAIVLWQGARDRNRTKCWIWLTVSIIVLILIFARFIIDCVKVRTGHVVDLVQGGVGILVDAYCIFIVYCFIQEVKQEQQSGETP
ncbi:uncharacterized protein LOC118433671 [Folsomia candida]|uniref:uncharacterized protein LOC118433671 n=1 Tax=Folsomia candida TaxID=158441 RepID=UPI001604B71E|nr:uncharacterized protein LOC118433671 [Folsomia candida]